MLNGLFADLQQKLVSATKVRSVSVTQLPPGPLQGRQTVDEAIVSQLVKLGYSRNAARRCTAKTGSVSKEAALQWAGNGTMAYMRICIYALYLYTYLSVYISTYIYGS